MKKSRNMKSIFKSKYVLGLLILALCVTSIILFNVFFKSRQQYNGPKELVLIHMDNCGHCKTLMPEWKKFVEKNNSDITIKDYEQSSKEGKVLVNRFNVGGFPTILLLGDNKKLKLDTYNGDRTTSGLLEYVNNQ